MDSIDDWRRTKYACEITPEVFGSVETVAGWVQDIRNLGGIAFILLRDSTGLIQITLIKKQDTEMFKRITELPRESVIMANGPVQENTQAKMGFELVPSGIKVLAEAKTPLPLGVVDKVGADMDTRLDTRFMDLRKHEVAAIFKIRATIL